MTQLTKKITVDDEERFESIDGSHHKTRSGARKRSIRVQEKESPPVEAPVEASPAEEPAPKPSEPAWASSDWGDDDGGPSEYVPGVLKQIKPPSIPKGKASKKQLEALKTTNIAVLKIGYKTADHGLTVYKRAALQDPEAAKITHSEADYEWISEISNEALMENGIMISNAIGPTQVAVLANGYWFIKPTLEIQNEAKKRGIKSKLGSTMRGFLAKLPIIGKRIEAKRHQEIADQLLGVKKDDKEE